VRFPFLNRKGELSRLRKALSGRESSLVCLYGRRRVGKSRLVEEALAGLPAVYYLADERDERLQRQALAREIDGLLPGFSSVEYPDWDALFDRWEKEAPAGAVLALDEVPYLVAAARALPSILQRRVDRPSGRRHWVLCGSSQRMMHGLVLDGAAPLYGRAREVMKVEPLAFPHVADALRLSKAEAAVEAFATWGGIPRYWELARDFRDLRGAQRALVLDPLGVLHREPDRLLLDEVRETMQAHSILALVGQGCHRLSEIAARLGKPATSLTRPLALLHDIGLVARELPFGEHPRSKRSRYRIADPFLRFWYRFVDPNRSLLEGGDVEAVRRKKVDPGWPHHVAEIWEELARASVPHVRPGGTSWGPASRWWGRTVDGAMVEIDVVAESLDDPDRLLVGEAKLSCTASEVARLAQEVEAKVKRCAFSEGKQLTVLLWVLRPRGRAGSGVVIDAEDVLSSWRAKVSR